jgi:sialate O-acetylesterase
MKTAIRLLALLVGMAIVAGASAETIRVACVGDSITAGVGVDNPGFNAYPPVLGRMLGGGWDVRNFGVSGRTMLKKGDNPYWIERAYTDALAFKPDILVILLGTNDSKHPTDKDPHATDNWQYRDEFLPDYEAMIAAFRAANRAVKVYVCLPVPAFPGQWGITEFTMTKAVAPLVRQVALDTGTTVIDLHAPLANHPELVPDTVHPNAAGAQIMAAAVYAALTGKAAPKADLHLNSLFQNNAVLQRGVRVPVWGTAGDGEKITVTFAGQTVTTIATNGAWKVWLQPMPANATPQTLTVAGDTTCTITNVLVGDVWVAGGQSNMERQLGPRPPQPEIIGWQEAAAAANYPDIHEFYVPEHLADAPAADAGGNWTVCSPRTAPDFCAVGFFFARDLYQVEKVPVGILFSAWGGTVAEAWTSADSLKTIPDFQGQIAEMSSSATGQEHYDKLLQQWYRDRDPGSGRNGNGDWSAVSLDTTDWKSASLPVQFSGDFDGLIWFRKVIELPDSWAGRPAVLQLGNIDDADTTWVNGVRVGATDDWQAQRNYPVAAGVLKPGRNVIAIRALNIDGPGGFDGKPEQMKLEVAGQPALAPVPLAGDWLSRVAIPKSNVSGVPARSGGGPNVPTVLYNAMIAPLQAFPIKGVIWYQGESNNDRARQYRTLFPLLIADWRRGWGLGDFPFLFVQIAPYQDMTPELREAQLLTLEKSPKTALAVTVDIGDAHNIHPAQKAPVGARLALAARALAYGEKIEYSGPLFAKMKIEGGKVVLSFTHLGGGLAAKDGALKGFTIAGADKKFVTAEAAIQGKTVVVWSDDVKTPVAVRYGWANVPDVNLFNRAGLPASPFRTDVD